MAQPRMEHGVRHEDGWRADAALSLKAGAEIGPGAAALQAGAIWRSDPESGCGEGGGEARALGGVSLGEGGRAFVGAEAAVRLHSGGCLRQRFELAGGVRPSEDWLGLVQAYSDVGQDGRAVIKAQVSVVRFGILGHGLQIGFRGRIDGNEAEPALILGWWGAARR